MNYRNLIFDQYNARVAISSYEVACGVCEYHLMVQGTCPTLSAKEQVTNALAAADTALASLPGDVQVAFRRFFVSDPANMAWLSELINASDSVVGQPPLDGTKVALWIYACTKMQSSAVQGYPQTHTCSHNGYKHIWMALRSHGAQPDSLDTTEDLLGRCIDVLDAAGTTLTDGCQRTWFFVHDIDVNYGGVVKGRNRVFDRHGLTVDTHYIASTGINGFKLGAKEPFVNLDAYGVCGLHPGQVTYLKASHMLNRTSDYGVAFERGTVITYGDRRHALISGTASINNRGDVMYHGDVMAQTRRMLQNVEALLVEGHCSMADITHLIVYLRDPSDYVSVSAYFKSHFPDVPAVIVWAPVCRPGWLIEVECSAINSCDDSVYPNF